jgi:hypothetical protein
MFTGEESWNWPGWFGSLPRLVGADTGSEPQTKCPPTAGGPLPDEMRHHDARVDAQKISAPAEGPVDRPPEGPRQLASRVRQLYEISKLLTSFEDVEKTITAIVGLMAQTFSLRSAIFILESARGGPPSTIVWQAAGASEDALLAAKTRARSSYAYLVRSDLDFDRDGGGARTLPPRSPEGVSESGSSSFILIPIVVDHHPIFGALQFETAGALGEEDRVFANAVVNQLAIALDRQATIDARQASATAGQMAAEFREARTEADRSWLKTVLDRMPSGVIIGSAPGGELVLANRQAEQIWGRPLALGAGTGKYRAFCGFHPTDGRAYEPEEWPLARSISKGEIVSEEEIDFFRGDGTRGTMISLDDIRARAKTFDFGGEQLAVASLEDVIRSKEAADRTKDRAALPILRDTAGALGAEVTSRTPNARQAGRSRRYRVISAIEQGRDGRIDSAFHRFEGESL